MRFRKGTGPVDQNIAPVGSPRKHFFPSPFGTVHGLAFTHPHMDHIGDPLLFPASTTFYVGNIMETMGPGYPEDLNSSVWSKELKDRKWVEIMKGERNWKPIGSFERGIDWFGDGSFWVLDAPGHMPGHLAYLARVSAEPETYILMSGDAAHDLCLFHPWPTPTGSDARYPMGYFGTGFDCNASHRPNCMHVDPAKSYETIARLSRMDAEDNVWVTLAHEREIVGVVDEFPKGAEGWMNRGWKAVRAQRAGKN